jgi:hypothetical protein
LSIFRCDGREQRARKAVGIERIGAGRHDEFAELANAAFLEQLRLVRERLQLRIKIPWFAHRKVSIE